MTLYAGISLTGKVEREKMGYLRQQVNIILWSRLRIVASI